MLEILSLLHIKHTNEINVLNPIFSYAIQH
jgi:hypothetical protein